MGAGPAGLAALLKEPARFAGRKVGLVLEFEALGKRGPLLLSGTRGGNGRLIADWASVVPQPRGSDIGRHQ